MLSQNTAHAPCRGSFRPDLGLTLCSLCALCFILLAPRLASAQHAPALADPITVDGHQFAVPTPVQAAWQDLELGAFIHLAPQTWQDHETDDLSTDLAAINPDKLNTDQWAMVARSMGANYIVFVAKHEGGFCWWQTDTTDFSVKNTPWRGGNGDVLADLAKTCQKFVGVKLGVYLSPQDKKHGIGIGGKADDPARQAEYENLFRQQLTEVLTRYGDMCEVWFDGSLVFDVGDILAAHAKNAVIFQGPQATIRWVGNEDGIAPYQTCNTVKRGVKKWGDYTAKDSDLSGDAWLPCECDARIRATWFWQTGNEKTLKSVPLLMAMYDQSVGFGHNLLLNLTPDRTGVIPKADAKRAAEFGDAIGKCYGSPRTAPASGKGKELVLKLPQRNVIDRVVIMEDITQGERIRRYELDALVKGAWEPLGGGELVGHKRIEAVAPVMVEGVRLRVTESVGEPIIRSLEVCSSGASEEVRNYYPPTNPAYHLVWSDEFDRDKLDATKWAQYSPGKRRDAVNVPEAVTLDGQGHLVITTSRHEVDDPAAPGGKRTEIRTGMISTQGLFETTYGYFEVRLKMQKEVGHWSAFWINTPTMGKPEGDPANAGVEIDVIEYLRNGHYDDKAQHTIHWDHKTPSYQRDTKSVIMRDIDEGFHTFGVQWLPDQLVFFDDGRQTWRTTKAIPKRDQYMILSLEVGKWADDIAKASLPDSLVVDYVRVYKTRN
jgi:alpha-L-fucosidase